MTREREPGDPPASTRPARAAYVVPRATLEPSPRWFWLGVAACSIAVAGFLLFRLTAWPPHEDETLALFVGRESLPDLL